jgi:hypothetical protein
MPEIGSEEGFLVRAESLALAQSVCEGLVDKVRILDGALLLAADPAWAWAINIVLVTKGVMVSELRRAGDLRAACGLSRERPGGRTNPICRGQ